MLNFRNCSGSRKVQQLREPIGDSSVKEEVALDLWLLTTCSLHVHSDGRQTGLGLSDSKVSLKRWDLEERGTGEAGKYLSSLNTSPHFYTVGYNPM